MKKTLIILISALLTGSIAMAQDNTKSDAPKAKSFIGIAGGYSNLMGHLTKTDYADNTSGYANKSGFNLGIEGAYYFHKNIGIGGVYSNTSFYSNGLQSMADGYKDSFDVDSTTVDVSGRYTMNNILIGPYFSFPVKKFTFDIRVVAGVSIAKTPKYTVYLEDQENATFYQNSSKATAFAFQLGAGVRYSIINNLCVKLNVDYLNTNPNFKIDNGNRANNAGRLITNYHQPIGILQLNLGIAYQFGKE